MAAAAYKPPHQLVSGLPVQNHQEPLLFEKAVVVQNHEIQLTPFETAWNKILQLIVALKAACDSPQQLVSSPHAS